MSTVSAIALLAPAKPRLSGERISVTCGKAAATASAEPSPEALSQTTVRIGVRVAAASVARQARVSARVL